MKKILYLISIFTVTSCGTPANELKTEQNTDEVTISENTVKFTERQVEIAEISQDTMSKELLSIVVDCNGVLKNDVGAAARISLPFDGVVSQIMVRPNQYVQKGDVLAVLVNPQYVTIQQEYLSALSKFKLDSLEFIRQSTLSKEDISTKKRFEEARSQYEISKINLSSSVAMVELLGLSPKAVVNQGVLKEIKLVAPISGSVMINSVVIGSMVESGSTMFEIFNNKHLIVDLTIFEKDIPLVKKGDKIDFSLIGDSNTTYTATIESIAATVDPASHSTHAIAKISSDVSALVNGLYVKAELLTSPKNCYTLPESAIVDLNGKRYAFIADGLSYKRVEVETGIERNHKFEIVNYDKFLKDTKFVVVGAYYIQSKF